MDQLNRPDIDSFKKQDKTPVIIVLDNVRSMHNVGSAFRTADGFALEKIILCGITATPPHREIEKTALGATQSVNWEHHDNIEETIDRLRAEGYTILAIEQAAGSVSLEQYKVRPSEKYALIFGNEVHGVSDEAMKKIDDCIEIPQFGTKHSFNVSVAIGVLSWHFTHKLVLFSENATIEQA